MPLRWALLGGFTRPILGDHDISTPWVREEPAIGARARRYLRGRAQCRIHTSSVATDLPGCPNRGAGLCQVLKDQAHLEARDLLDARRQVSPSHLAMEEEKAKARRPVGISDGDFFCWRSRDDRYTRYIRHLEITSWCLTGRSSPRYLPVAVPGVHVPKSEKAPRTVPALLERFTSFTGCTCSFHRGLFIAFLFSSSSFQFLASHARVRPRRQLGL